MVHKPVTAARPYKKMLLTSEAFREVTVTIKMAYLAGGNSRGEESPPVLSRNYRKVAGYPIAAGQNCDLSVILKLKNSRYLIIVANFSATGVGCGMRGGRVGNAGP